MHLDSTDKFIYSMIHLIIYFKFSGTFLYINSIGFLKGKFCLFLMLILFIYCARLSVTYMHVSLHIPLYFVCVCSLFVQHLHVFVPTLLCICLCSASVFVLTMSCECFCVNCQTIRTLQNLKTIFKVSCKRRNCSTRCIL